MKTSIFYPFDPIYILASLPSFKLAWKTNGIYRSAALRLFHFFVKNQPPAASSSRIALRPKSSHRPQNESTIPAYCEVVNYLMETYATDDVKAETEETHED